jgi:hypothetical protein
MVETQTQAVQAKKERPAALEAADRALRAAIARVAGGAFPELTPLARALGHVDYSPRNRLLIGVQLPQALRVKSPGAWEATGYRVRPGERGAAILAPGEAKGEFTVRFVFGDEQVEPDYLLPPLPPEDFLPALERWTKPEDGEGTEAFLKAAARFAAGRLGHGRDARLWEELRQAELWMAAQGVEVLLGVEGVVPPLPEGVLRKAFGNRPAVLHESLLRVGEALTHLARQVGLLWR